MDKINYIQINTNDMFDNIKYLKEHYQFSYYIFDVSNNAFHHGMYLIKYFDQQIDYLYVHSLEDLLLIRKYNQNISVIYHGNINQDNIFDLIINNAIIVISNIDTLKMIKEANIKDTLNFLFLVDPTGFYGISNKQDILDYLEWNDKYLHLVGFMANFEEKNYENFKYIIRPIQSSKLMIFNNEEKKEKIQGSNAIILDSSIYGINGTKKKLFQKSENTFKQIFCFYSKITDLKEVIHNKKTSYIAIVPFGYHHGMNDRIKSVFIHNKLYSVLKIYNKFMYIEGDEFLKKDMKVEITSKQNPLENYFKDQTLTYFSFFNSNHPIVFDDYILEKMLIY